MATSNHADNHVDNDMKLPVFCISSHAYQSLEGLSSGFSDSVTGFDNIEDTEIPQLQQHAQGLTDDLRIAKNREVLATISQLLNSISLWTQNVPDFNTALDAEMLKSLLNELERVSISSFPVSFSNIQPYTFRKCFQRLKQVYRSFEPALTMESVTRWARSHTAQKW